MRAYSGASGRSAGCALGNRGPGRIFGGRAAEYLLQVGVEDMVAAVLGRGHYERAAGPVTGYRNGYGQHTLKTEAGPLHLRPPKVRQTARPASVALPETLTGTHRFRFLKTPHLPHAWEAGLLFEQTSATLLFSDLFHQAGDPEPIAHQDVTKAMARRRCASSRWCFGRCSEGEAAGEICPIEDEEGLTT